MTPDTTVTIPRASESRADSGAPRVSRSRLDYHYGGIMDVEFERRGNFSADFSGQDSRL